MKYNDIVKQVSTYFNEKNKSMLKNIDAGGSITIHTECPNTDSKIDVRDFNLIGVGAKGGYFLKMKNINRCKHFANGYIFFIDKKQWII